MNLLEQKIIRDYEKVIEEIDSIFKQYEIEYCVIGGIALSKYDYIRATADIDVLLDAKDRSKLKKIPIGFLKQLSSSLRTFKLQQSKVELDVIYSGDHAGNNLGIEYLSPRDVSKNHFIKIDYLIAYKISAGLYGNRLKDFGDVQELIKRNNLSPVLLNGFRNDIQNKYREIWKLTFK